MELDVEMPYQSNRHNEYIQVGENVYGSGSVDDGVKLQTAARECGVPTFLDRNACEHPKEEQYRVGNKSDDDASPDKIFCRLAFRKHPAIEE